MQCPPVRMCAAVRVCKSFGLQVVALCCYKRTRTSMPRLVVLVAAEEELNHAGQQARSAGQLVRAQLSTC